MPATDNKTDISELEKHGATIPQHGGVYWLRNIKYGRYMNVDFSGIADGTHLITWLPLLCKNEQFRYSEYYNGKAELVFTLECMSTVQSKNQVGGRGGFMRLDSTTNEVIQGGSPLAWKLIEVVPGIFQIAPFDDTLSKNGTLVVTDAKPECALGKVNLKLSAKKGINEAPFEQYWVFVKLD